MIQAIVKTGHTVEVINGTVHRDLNLTTLFLALGMMLLCLILFLIIRELKKKEEEILDLYKEVTALKRKVKEIKNDAR